MKKCLGSLRLRGKSRAGNAVAATPQLQRDCSFAAAAIGVQTAFDDDRHACRRSVAARQYATLRKSPEVDGSLLRQRSNESASHGAARFRRCRLTTPGHRPSDRWSGWFVVAGFGQSFVVARTRSGSVTSLRRQRPGVPYRRRLGLLYREMASGVCGRCRGGKSRRPVPC